MLVADGIISFLLIAEVAVAVHNFEKSDSQFHFKMLFGIGTNILQVIF